MIRTSRLLAVLAGLGLAAAPALGQNLLGNGDFEQSPPNLGWQGSLDIDSTIHKPGGTVPNGGLHYGSVQAGGNEIVRLANHQPVALSNVGPKDIKLTGYWGAGTTCALTNNGPPCRNYVKPRVLVRVHDGNAAGPVVALESRFIDHGTGDDPTLPNGFDWTPFTITGSAASGQATVEFGWIDATGQWSDGTGVHADNLVLTEVAAPVAVHLISAVSNRTHGAAGVFGNTAPLSGSPLIEPRQNGSAAQMVLTFDGAPVATDGTINCGQEVVVTNGTCSSVSVSGNDLTVNMTFNKNACVKVAVNGLVGLTGDNDVDVVAHEGNANQTAGVNILDLQAIKNQLNQPVNIINYNLDVNVNGSINILDLQATKNNLNQAAGACN